MPHAQRATSRAFTLLEVIGVLAVIAILALLLIPQIFEAIHKARLNLLVGGIHTIKTSAVQHYGTYGSLASSNGTRLEISTVYRGFDIVLLREALLDKPFSTRFGTNSEVRLVNVAGLTRDDGGSSKDGAYDLDGDGKNDVTGSSYLADVVIYNVSEEDAVAINDMIDGTALGMNPSDRVDSRGRVTHKDPNRRKTRDVYIYVTHGR